MFVCYGTTRLEEVVSKPKKLIIITIFYIKKRLTILNGQLGDDRNCPENIGVLREWAVAEFLVQRLPILEALVDSFVSSAHTLLHCLILFRVCNTFGALDVQWSSTDAPVVGFCTFARVKHAHQCGLKNH